ncbi:MAG TPA: universal stress protein [Nitrospiraceae bacterium]|nr:universal stress protein [Nitrospiraceae bacterium]
MFLNRILFATDFSEGAARAQATAFFLASACRARLEFLHVFEYQPDAFPANVINDQVIDEIRAGVGRQLDELVSRATEQGLSASARQCMGIASEQIIEAATPLEADLIIVGTHGRTGLEHILLGSTAERVVKGAPCPVLTVRAGRSMEAAEPIRICRILAPIDFSDCSLDALEYAVQVAKQFTAAVTLLHVMEWRTIGLNFSLADLAEGHKAREQVQCRVAELTNLFRSQGIEATYAIRGIDPADTIVDYALDQRVDLIIMGTHGRRGISRALAGSVAEAVLRRSHCPVLTVKSPKFRPDHGRVLTTAMKVEH